LPPENGKPESFGTTVTEVSERVSVLVREEIELAKAEMMVKVMSIARGAAAIAAGAVFGVFAIVIGLEALAWGLDSILVQGAGDIWEGFLIVFGVLAILAVLAFAIATRMLKRGAPPTPTMAIDEAKRIRETVAAKSEVEATAATREIQG
jgi:MFS family permease